MGRSPIATEAILVLVLDTLVTDILWATDGLLGVAESCVEVTGKVEKEPLSSGTGASLFFSTGMAKGVPPSGRGDRGSQGGR